MFCLLHGWFWNVLGVFLPQNGVAVRSVWPSPFSLATLSLCRFIARYRCEFDKACGRGVEFVFFLVGALQNHFSFLLSSGLNEWIVTGLFAIRLERLQGDSDDLVVLNALRNDSKWPSKCMNTLMKPMKRTENQWQNLMCL